MFQMTNSGLDNIWLESGFDTGEDDFGPYYTIQDIPGLYKAIALELAHGQGEISAKELRLVRQILNLKQRELAKEIGRTEQTVTLWEKESPTTEKITKIPTCSAILIKLLILNHFLPGLAIRDCRAHIDLPRLPKLVFSYRDGNWLSSRDYVGKTSSISKWCADTDDASAWRIEPRAGTVLQPVGLSYSSSKAINSNTGRIVTKPSTELLEWKP